MLTNGRDVLSVKFMSEFYYKRVYPFAWFFLRTVTVVSCMKRSCLKLISQFRVDSRNFDEREKLLLVRSSMMILEISVGWYLLPHGRTGLSIYLFFYCLSDAVHFQCHYPRREFSAMYLMRICPLLNLHLSLSCQLCNNY